MKQTTIREGIKHLLSTEPGFQNFVPHEKIELFLRPAGFEGICALVIEQQISVAAANSIKKRVFGLMKKVNARDFLKLKDDIIRNAGLSRPKINYLKGVAEKEVNGQFNFAHLEKLNDKDAHDYLCQLKGIGSWTADCYLMACLGRADIWPVGDIGLQESVKKLKNLKERPSVEDMTSIARDWRPFRSVAANLLWADYD